MLPDIRHLFEHLNFCSTDGQCKIKTLPEGEKPYSEFGRASLPSCFCEEPTRISILLIIILHGFTCHY